ncbi:hypothetical protein ABKN59_010612 [Abortiporus biennis]
MAYRYYQTAYPGWGTSQVQLGAPPIPNIQPLSSWNGSDFYNAFAVNPDPSLYYSITSRLREFAATGGAGLHEARSWHRRIYGGVVPLTQALPVDIGAAAAYEAYRVWRHHHNVMFAPLNGEIEREREGLIGLASAEATHLWQYSGRPMDTYGLRDALESAAQTAMRISYRVLGEERDAYLSRRDSISSSGYSSSYGGSEEDLYRPRHKHRHRRHSSIGSAPIIIGAAPQGGSPYLGAPGVPPMGMPGAPGTVYGNGYPGYPGGGLPGSYPGSYSTTMLNANPYIGGNVTPNPYGATLTVPPPAGYGGGVPMTGGASPYGGMGYPAAGYATPGYATPGYATTGYATPGYATPGAGYYGQPSAQGQTIIIPSSRSRRSSTSGHHHHHRNHSRG